VISIPMLVPPPIPASLAAKADLSVPLAARGKKSGVRGQRHGGWAVTIIPFRLYRR
jgi:hypothetical protein